jgi:hypothetical protein
MVLRIVGWAVLGFVALGVAAFAATFAWIAATFPELDDPASSVPWALVAAAGILAVGAVVGAAACGQAAVTGASRTLRHRR